MTQHRQRILVLVLAGLLAAPGGWAAENDDATGREASRELAREANEIAAREAAAAVRTANRPELDIRPPGPTSETKQTAAGR